MIEQISPLFLPTLIFVALWEGAWKAVAFWKSARNNQLGWFIAILLINSAGILPITYLFFFQKENTPSKALLKKKKR